MLKERHHKNEQNQSQYDARYKRSITSNQISVKFFLVSSIDHMKGRIRLKIWTERFVNL